MNDIVKTLQFMVEIEKLKDVYRKSKPIGLDRYENSAEHSWHACISALALREHANEKVDIDKVIKMLLVHDLGEIDAGDTIVYNSNTPEIKAKEITGARRVFSILPDELRDEFMELWNEFEYGENIDAEYARAIDRIPPILQNLHSNGHTWRKHNISEDRILALNSKIKNGSQALWDCIESELKEAFSKGLLLDKE